MNAGTIGEEKKENEGSLKIGSEQTIGGARIGGMIEGTVWTIEELMMTMSAVLMSEIEETESMTEGAAHHQPYAKKMKCAETFVRAAAVEGPIARLFMETRTRTKLVGTF